MSEEERVKLVASDETVNTSVCNETSECVDGLKIDMCEKIVESENVVTNERIDNELSEDSDKNVNIACQSVSVSEVTNDLELVDDLKTNEVIGNDCVSDASGNQDMSQVDAIPANDDCTEAENDRVCCDFVGKI